jgi:hypothetical protein
VQEHILQRYSAAGAVEWKHGHAIINAHRARAWGIAPVENLLVRDSGLLAVILRLRGGVVQFFGFQPAWRASARLSECFRPGAVALQGCEINLAASNGPEICGCQSDQ